MSVKTGGRVRGFISRWLFRFDAASGILSNVFQGTTAVSALSGLLAYIGYQWAVPYVLGGGLVGVFAFAYAYDKSGVYNRKNRERMDRGDNFAGPGMAMSLYTQGDQFAAGLAEALDADEDRVRGAVETATRHRMSEYRDGIDVEDAFTPPTSNGRREGEA